MKDNKFETCMALCFPILKVSWKFSYILVSVSSRYSRQRSRKSFFSLLSQKLCFLFKIKPIKIKKDRIAIKYKYQYTHINYWIKQAKENDVISLLRWLKKVSFLTHGLISDNGTRMIIRNIFVTRARTKVIASNSTYLK